MLNYVNSFFDEFNFTSTERVTLAIAYEKLRENGEAYEQLTKIIAAYENDINYLSTLRLAELEAIAAKSGVQVDTVFLLMLIAMTKKLRERLLALGMSKKNTYLTLSDLIYKMHEEERTLNIVGTNKFSWYTKFFKPTIFAIGRLQFELATYTDETVEVNGKTLKKGAPVLKVHIPMSGEPLDEKACAASYRDAKKFFLGLLGIEDIAFTCASWLLSPDNSKFLGENSNIVKFASKYNITGVVEFDDSTAVFPWLFDVAPATPLEKLPRNTTLRRAYAEHLQNGGKVLSGSGFFYIEPPKPKEKKPAQKPEKESTAEEN